MNNRFNRHQTKETLLNRQQRLQTLMKADVPILEDVGRHTGTDIAERLQGVLADYALTLEAWLQEIERADKGPAR